MVFFERIVVTDGRALFDAAGDIDHAGTVQQGFDQAGFAGAVLPGEGHGADVVNVLGIHEDSSIKLAVGSPDPQRLARVFQRDCKSLKGFIERIGSTRQKIRVVQRGSTDAGRERLRGSGDSRPVGVRCATLAPGLQQPGGSRLGDGLGLRTHVQFAVQIANVMLNGGQRNAHQFGRFPVTVTAGKVLKNLLFPG